MKTNKKKVVLIGAGNVGMSYAYSMINKGVCDELVIIDINEKKAQGEAIDLSHGIPFAPVNTQVSVGSYRDCADAAVVAISAGVSQKNGETRMELLNRNAGVFHDVISQVMNSGFDGVFLIATNPVDVMSVITANESKLPPNRIIGSGTVLDTARLRFTLGERLGVDPRNVHAYVLGEHGDSEFVPWSQATIGTKSVTSYLKNKGCEIDLDRLEEEVRNSAYTIIEAKGSTYYGIGMAMARITQAILSDENSILTVSAPLRGHYNLTGVWLGLPAVVGKGGVREIINLDLTEEELAKLQKSAKIIGQATKKCSV